MRLGGFGVVLVSMLAACSSSSNSGGSLDGGFGGAGTGTGGGPPLGCTAFAACGGNVVGTWTISTLCGPGAMQTQAITGCTGGTGTITISATGSLVFGADMSYTVMTTTSGTAVEKLPKSCFTGGATCAQVQDALLMMQGTFSGGTCTDDGTNCNCNLTLTPTPDTETGTYTISGSTITTMPTTAGAAPGTSQFCVSGNQLSVASTDTTQPMLVIVARK